MITDDVVSQAEADGQILTVDIPDHFLERFDVCFSNRHKADIDLVCFHVRYRRRRIAANIVKLPMVQRWSTGATA
jgi:hypothetical protein